MVINVIWSWVENKKKRFCHRANELGLKRKKGFSESKPSF